MFIFAEPWHACEDSHFEDELRREVPRGHVLFGVAVKILARRQDIDDFLFELPGGRFANVHLTWSCESDPVWPNTEIYESAEHMQTEVQKHIDEWNMLEGT